MTPRDLEDYVAYYLPRLGADEDAFFSLIERRDGIVPLLVRAFRSEQDPRRKARVLEVTWQHRDPSTISVLAEALLDPAPEVWKESLNGLVALDGPECEAALEAARGRRFDSESEGAYFRELVDEALDQLRHGFFGEKR